MCECVKLPPKDLAAFWISRGGGKGEGGEQQLDSRLRTSENAITTSGSRASHNTASPRDVDFLGRT